MANKRQRVYNEVENNGSSRQMARKKQRLTKEVEISGEIIGYYSPKLFLSDDLISEILIRLPAKPLFRFKCVSKGWESLISNPSFVKRLKSHPPLTAGYFYYDENKKNVNYLCGGFNDEINSNSNGAVVDTHLSFLPFSTVVISSHSGLLLCIKKPKSFYPYPGPINYFVCNPFTKQFIALPQLYATSLVDALLFCYEEEEECHSQQVKFKVVCVGWKAYYMLDVDTYSSETKEWERTIIYHEQYDQFIPKPYSSVFLKGSLYVRNDDIEMRLLCVYDMKEKRACFTVLPSLSNCDKWTGRLVVSGESVYFAEGDRTHFNVWRLVDGMEWSLKHHIAYRTLSHSMLKLPETSAICNSIWSPSCRLVDHELILVTLGKQGCYEHFLYRIKKRRMERISNFRHNTCFPVIAYSLPAWMSCLRNNLCFNAKDKQKAKSDQRRGYEIIPVTYHSFPW